MTVPQLWTRHRSLALAIAGDYYLPGSDREDVEQEALIGLWIAARRYDPAGGATFPGFARLVIKRRLTTLLQLALAQKHQPLTQSVRHVRDDTGDWVEVLDTLPGGDDPHQVAVARETVDRLVAALETLTPLERDAVIRVAAGVPYHGDRRVDNAVQRARRKLRSAA